MADAMTILTFAAASAAGSVKARVGQLSAEDLALDLEPDEEEKTAINRSSIQSSSGFESATGGRPKPSLVSHSVAHDRPREV